VQHQRLGLVVFGARVELGLHFDAGLLAGQSLVDECVHFLLAHQQQAVQLQQNAGCVHFYLTTPIFILVHKNIFINISVFISV